MQALPNQCSCVETSSVGLWGGTPGDGEGAKYWLTVRTELKDRGVADTLFTVCVGLKVLPDVVESVWLDSTMQTCVIRLLCNSFRLSRRKHWDQISKELKPVYTACSRWRHGRSSPSSSTLGASGTQP